MSRCSPSRQRRLPEALDKLDLIVAIDVNFSEIAWYADVILPESIYLERADSIQAISGLKPQLYMRRQAVTPRYDTRPAWLILKQLAQRLDLGKYFPYETIEDIWNFQLQDMGVKIEDFDAKGFVALTDQTLLWDREKGIKFKTPSGKIELVSPLHGKRRVSVLPALHPGTGAVRQGGFRLMVGRCAVHTHLSTQNNLYLNELVPENDLVDQHRGRAAAWASRTGQEVEVVSPWDHRRSRPR